MKKVDEVKNDQNMQGIVKTIVSQADNFMKSDPQTVTHKKKCLSGNIHNFESLSIYYWPNPDDPNGPYICKDGYFNPEYKDYDLPKLISFTNRVKTLTLAYYLSGDNRYAEQCVKELKIWFLNEETYMTPTFEFAQCAPGKWNGKGAAAGLVDAYYFIDILEAIRVMMQYGFIDKSTDEGLKVWFADFYQWTRYGEKGIAMSTRTNNLSVAYDVLVYAMASYLGKTSDCKKIRNQFISQRINKQIKSDGTQPEELKRQTALTYSVQNIGHIIDFCVMAENDGNSFYKKNYKRIDAALNFLHSYVGKKESFEYSEVGNWSLQEQKICMELRRLSRLKKNKKSISTNCSHQSNIKLTVATLLE